MDLLAALAAEKDAAARAAKESGLSAKGFAVYWTIREDAALKTASVNPMELARECERQLAKFANAGVNPDEQRQLRAALYLPLLRVPATERSRLVELIAAILTQ